MAVGIHGGWWRAAHGLETHAHLCAALVESGVATWNIEYRRLGEDGGGWPGTLVDVGKALDFLHTLASMYPFDLSRVVTVGFSAGGHLALWAAARQRVEAMSPLGAENPFPIKAAISLAGASDLVRCAELGLSGNVVESFLGGSPTLVPDRYAMASPTALLPLGTKQILIHGTSDSSVPCEISQRHYAEAVSRGDKCDLLLLPGVEHLELIDPLASCWRAVHDTILAAL